MKTMAGGCAWGNWPLRARHSINGVSALHSGLMKETVFKDLNTLYPGRINNKTNGITPRRWLQQINPGLTQLVREAIGPKFLDNAEELITLDRFADDAGFLEKYAAIKRANKQKLSQLILQRTGISTDPSALFDVQIKRIHEYKRQLLAILETIALYNSIRAHPGAGHGSAGEDFCRQGGGKLLGSQDDHPAHQ